MRFDQSEISNSTNQFLNVSHIDKSKWNKTMY